MPPQAPRLDPRTYEELVRDAMARIPVHNPEWTNFNDSDPGITLLQLFAFMADNILYRANQIPERNRRKFLKLLGIGLRPAASATGFVTIQNERGPLASQVVPADVDARAGDVRFRTQRGLTVLPVEARIFTKRALPAAQDARDRSLRELYADLYADLTADAGSQPQFYETAAMPLPLPGAGLPEVDLKATVDGCLWIALLARPQDARPADAGALDAVRAKLANQVLTVGVMPLLDDEGIVAHAGETQRRTTRMPAYWEIADAGPEGEARYRALAARSDDSPLAEAALVELTLPDAAGLRGWDWAALEPGLEGTGEYPPSLADTNYGDRVITWLRLRVDKSRSAKARIAWVGINATRVRQAALVSNETVGRGTGEPDQELKLANTPALPETLKLRVNGAAWRQVDDLLAAAPEAPAASPRRPLSYAEVDAARQPGWDREVYTLDPESGTVRFGDGAHGTRPPAGALITADYAYGGGRQGNVGIGALNRSPQLEAHLRVTNPLPTWGGDDAESPAEAEKTIPRAIQYRDRLVNEQDFRDITARAPGVDMGRVEVVPLLNPAAASDVEAPGAVTVMVIPAGDATAAPMPDQFFLETVCDHLMPRRLVTTELHVRGPEYVDIWVSAAVEVLGGYAGGPVREAVKAAIRQFLSPLRGGRAGTGWPLKTAVLAPELAAVIARVDGVRMAQGPVLLGTKDADSVTEVRLVRLQLPRLVAVEIVDAAEAAAPPIAQLKQAPALDPQTGGQKWTPIPVLPERC